MTKYPNNVSNVIKMHIWGNKLSIFIDAYVLECRIRDEIV
jgi:hypothetical protein